MAQTTRMPLESYLLAQQSAPIECLVCGEENCRSSARCHNCSAPMALAHQALAVKQPARLIAVLGASGAGKTTYLGMMMDMLTRQVGSLRTTPRGPLSISLQQTTSTALSTGSFPEKTNHHPDHWHWVHCQLHCQRRRRPMELVIPDISGDALAEETEKAGQYPAIRALLKKCSAVMVLADAERLKGGDRSHDFITMKLLSLLSDFRSKPRIFELGSGEKAIGVRVDEGRRLSGLCRGSTQVCRGTRRCVVDQLPDEIRTLRSVRVLGGWGDGVSRHLWRTAARSFAD